MKFENIMIDIQTDRNQHVIKKEIDKLKLSEIFNAVINKYLPDNIEKYEKSQRKKLRKIKINASNHIENILEKGKQLNCLFSKYREFEE